MIYQLFLDTAHFAQYAIVLSDWRRTAAGPSQSQALECGTNYGTTRGHSYTLHCGTM